MKVSKSNSPSKKKEEILIYGIPFREQLLLHKSVEQQSLCGGNLNQRGEEKEL